MKKLLLTISILVFTCTFISQAQTSAMIDNFDNSATGVYQLSTEGSPSLIELSTNTVDKVEGTGALDVKAVIGAFHQWGSYAQLLYRTDSTEVLDWSIIGDSLSIWIKVRTAPTIPANMVFRVHVVDRPSESDPLEEYIYENATIIDAQHDWVQLIIPFIEREQTGTTIPDGTGFILAPTSWGGFTYNNSVLDRDKIVGLNIGLITTGWDPNANIPADSLTVSLDGFERLGLRSTPAIIFNGIEFPTYISTWAWGQSVISVETGAGPLPNTNAIKWVQGNEWSNGWTGMGADIVPAFNLAGSWSQDSVKFKLKCEAGVGPMRMQFESGAAKKGTVFTPTADGQWHSYSLPLREMVYQDGTSGFDTSMVQKVGLMAEASGIAGKVVYITDWWTGQPTFDVVPPIPPINVTSFTGSFQNIVLWDDVPGETGERYNIYYSKNPITSINGPGVEVAKLNVGEGVQLAEHLLYAPNTNQDVTYYYAVVCKDASGNISALSTNSAPLTNQAKGVSTISINAPNFTADGNLGEWQSITPFRMFPSDGSGTIVTNTTINGDNDLSVRSWVAVDADYLYLAFDVTDDVVAGNVNGTSYQNDCPDLYLGLYNWRGAPHTTYRRGAEPDYHFRFAHNRVILDGIAGADSILGLGANYYWAENFPNGYIVECKISWVDLAAAGGDNIFSPVEGYRIPIDYAINDNDLNAANEREGILTYSPFNEDQSWSDVSRWLYTWIGSLWEPVSVKEDGQQVVNEFALSQNYPNPFNPTTQIKFSIKESGLVSLKIFDILGTEVATLVNNEYPVGNYTVDFNAAGIASGIYFYKIQSGNFVETKKMILMK